MSGETGAPATPDARCCWGVAVTATLAPRPFPPLAQKALDRANYQPTRSFVYFIADMGAKRVKIGVAKDVRARLAQLQAANASELKFLGCLAGAQGLERELHGWLHADRTRGEWFAPSADLMRLIYAAHKAATGRAMGEEGPTIRRGTVMEDEDGETAGRPRLQRGSATDEINELARVMGITVDRAREYYKAFAGAPAE